MDKIRVGNFKGLNLTDLKMKFVGEFTLKEAKLEELVREGVDMNEQKIYREQVQDLKELIKKVEDRLVVQLQLGESFDKKSKVGATLKSSNELEEWLETQHYMKQHQMEKGSNVFTYKTRKPQTAMAADNPEQQELLQLARDSQLQQEISQLQLLTQKSKSGMATRESSVEPHL